jgi:Tfp pilus assembly protein PilZ
MHGETQNISLNGAFICCEKVLPPNETLLLTVNGPSGPMQVIARVVWSNLRPCDAKASTTGIGVKFMWSLPRPESELVMWTGAG